jgi:hypothetical protein
MMITIYPILTFHKSYTHFDLREHEMERLPPCDAMKCETMIGDPRRLVKTILPDKVSTRTSSFPHNRLPLCSCVGLIAP